jgi:hypothetical protein
MHPLPEFISSHRPAAHFQPPNGLFRAFGDLFKNSHNSASHPYCAYSENHYTIIIPSYEPIRNLQQRTGSGSNAGYRKISFQSKKYGENCARLVFCEAQMNSAMVPDNSVNIHVFNHLGGHLFQIRFTWHLWVYR